MRQRIRRWIHETEGSNLIETALLSLVLMPMLVGAVDYGRAYYIAIELTAAAHAGAMYGSQNPTDTGGMETAAQMNATDVAITATAMSSCECYDGSASACTAAFDACPDTGNPVRLVQVTASATYTPMLSLFLDFIHLSSSIPLSAQAQMRAAY
ncbi:MAG TPA: TadE/TadG family type IV pilus assembly protein [Granulicella sp.]